MRYRRTSGGNRRLVCLSAAARGPRSRWSCANQVPSLSRQARPGIVTGTQNHSFPSGHAAMTFATVTVSERQLAWRKGWASARAAVHRGGAIALFFVFLLFFLFIVLGLAGREVVDFFRQILVNRIDVVQRERPARRLHRNRTAGPLGVLLLRSLLTA